MGFTQTTKVIPRGHTHTNFQDPLFSHQTFPTVPAICPVLGIKTQWHHLGVSGPLETEETKTPTLIFFHLGVHQAVIQAPINCGSQANEGCQPLGSMTGG